MSFINFEGDINGNTIVNATTTPQVFVIPTNSTRIRYVNIGPDICHARINSVPDLATIGDTPILPGESLIVHKSEIEDFVSIVAPGAPSEIHFQTSGASGGVDHGIPFGPIVGFITTWDTTLPGVTGANDIRLPLESGGDYDFVVDWGDGSESIITSFDPTESAHTHTYGAPGPYTVTVEGLLHGWRFNNGGDAGKLTGITQFGPMRVGNNGNYFHGCINLVTLPNDALSLIGTTNLQSVFENCALMTGATSLSLWNVAAVTNMSFAFSGCSVFNGDVTTWHTGEVTNMQNIFSSCLVFNQPVGVWSVGKVTFLNNVFQGCSIFNQSVDAWDIRSAINIGGTFTMCTLFNQPLNSWNLASVTQMNSIFANAIAFNQPLNSWDVSKISNLTATFLNAAAFDQDLDSWDVSNAVNTTNMFNGAVAFSKDITDWDTSNIVNMDNMFNGAVSVNQRFDKWRITALESAVLMFNGVTLSTANYDELLDEWEQQLPNINDNVTFDGGNSQYFPTGPGVFARNNLVNNHGWVITDGGAA